MSHIPKEVNEAIDALKSRKFFFAFPEFHKAYPEEWMKDGEVAFNNSLGNYFKEIEFGKNVTWIGEEVSPITLKPLGIKYPAAPVEDLVKQAEEVKSEWKGSSINQRVEILWDALNGMKRRFFEIAHATTHTTGQSFMMAFQASGPHAADRALEAIALGFEELTRIASEVEWEKPMGKASVKLKKQFKPIPKGVGLVIGCSTFPVWNSLPGIFANLICGNPVIVKPHSLAILPLAIALCELQKSLKKAGFSVNIVQIAVDTQSNPITKQLAEHPLIKLIDYTGNTTFGNYLEGLKGKTVFTEKSAINPVIIDSSENLEESLQNLTFSMLLYSGQMCTAPQNIYISEKGVKTPERTVSYPEVVKLLNTQLSALLNHPKIGAGTMANIQNQKTVSILKSLAPIKAAENGVGRTLNPTLVEITGDNKLVNEEVFGPFFKLVKTRGIDHSLSLAKENAQQHGAITCLAFCAEQKLKDKILNEMESVFTPVSFNLKGNFWVNQHAAFSDFHVTGGNASGNASFTNPNFINQRFVWLGHREME